MNTIDETAEARDVLLVSRDWEIIKQTQLDFLPEAERDAFLETMVRMAVYN